MMCLSRFVLLSLHMCVTVTAWMHSSGDGYQLQCGFVDKEHVCIAKDMETVLIPCGQFPQQIGISYTYYILGSTEALAEGITDYLSLNVSRTDNGIHICCKPNVSASISDYPCYRLNITYAPVEVSLQSPRGYNKWPVFGEPYGLTCPLEGNPNATYKWRRSSLDSVERLNISSDVKFTEDGRSWHVDAFIPEYKGLYSCNATNTHGTADYHNDNLFYLTTEKCSSGRLPGDPNIELSPTNNSDYPEGTTVELNCAAVFADYTSEKPSWYKKNGSDDTYCDGPEYKQTANYDNVTCKWSNYLTIYNFTVRHTGDYMCGFFQHTKSLTLELSVDTQRKDPKTLTAIVPATALLVTFFLMVFMVFAVIKVIHKSKLPSYRKSMEPPYKGFTYDVFISAHDEAREFVQDQILQPLEHQCNPPYKVCWHLRDFIAGIPITEQIADAVLQSRKIIFVFSTHFMDSTFCQIELQHSLHRLSTTRTRCIVPITLSELCVPNKVKSILTYWPIIPADEDQMMGKICHFLGFPMEELVISMEDEALLH